MPGLHPITVNRVVIGRNFLSRILVFEEMIASTRPLKAYYQNCLGHISNIEEDLYRYEDCLRRYKLADLIVRQTLFKWGLKCVPNLYALAKLCRL